MKIKQRHTYVKSLLILPVLCLLLVTLSAISNLGAPHQSSVIEYLDDLEKAHILEAFHLRQSLGDSVWPGWSQADIPVIVYKEEFAFLIGIENPSDGWVSISAFNRQGGPWELVPGDDFFGQSYYRQRLPADGTTPQSFTVMVGDHWAASLQTQEYMLISLSQQIRNDFGPLFPHWQFARLMMGGSDGYICWLLHESFHAFEGMTAYTRILASEEMNIHWADSYPVTEESFQADWQIELDMLESALRAPSDSEAIALVEQFLEHRTSRRRVAGLSSSLIEYEQWREWEEGLAKYAELEIWRKAFTSPAYEPVPAILLEPDFGNYEAFPRRWRTELSNLTKRAKDDGDGRFYYTGMAQAFLLDRLMPEWKEHALKEGVWLEDLLSEAVLSGK